MTKKKRNIVNQNWEGDGYWIHLLKEQKQRLSIKRDEV